MPTRTVYENAKLPELLHHVLHHAAPGSRLIICMKRETFLDQLLQSLEGLDRQTEYQQDFAEEQDQTELTTDHAQDSRQHAPSPLFTNSINEIVKSRNTTVSFIPSTLHLLAYFATLQPSTSAPPTGRAAAPSMFILNLLSLHADSPTFSAQGLSQSLASIAETGLHLRMPVVLAECIGSSLRTRGFSDVDPDHDPDMNLNLDPDYDMIDSFALTSDVQTLLASDPWSTEIPVLNSHAKTYGRNPDTRELFQKKVSVRSVVGRWFRFVPLPAVLEEYGHCDG